MKGKNRLMALVVVLALMLSTVPAFAAQFDFVNKDTRDPVGFFEALDDTDLFLDIYDNMEKYVIEVGGKYYDVAAVNARTADGISIGDAVADMEPVDLDEPAEELEVVSVSAINSKQAEVKFNKEVKEVKPANFKVTDIDGNLLFVSKAELNEEKTVATLSFFDAFADKGVYTVEVTNVEDVDGNVMEKDTAKFEYVKADVKSIEFTATTLATTKNISDIVKVTDELGRDVTKEVELTIQSSDTDVVGNDGNAKKVGTSVVVVGVKGTDIKTKATVVTVQNSVETTFVGYNVYVDGNNPAADTEAFLKLDEKDKMTYVAMEDANKKLALYYNDQYGDGMYAVPKDETKVTVTNLTPDVVIVNGTTGKITPISVGTGYVKVKVANVETTIEIEVREKSVATKLELDKTELTVVEKATVGQKFEVKFKDQYGGEITEIDGVALEATAKVKDDTIAKLDKTTGTEFTVTGLKEGTTTIEVSYKVDDDTTLKETVNVEVTKAGAFAGYEAAVDTTELDINAGGADSAKDAKKEAQITVYKVDAAGNRLDTETADLIAVDKDGDADVNIVKINNEGKVEAVNVGTGYVQVKVGSLVVDTIEFTVINTASTPTTAEVDSLTLSEKFSEVNCDELEGVIKRNIVLKDQYGNVMKDADKKNIQPNTIKYTLTNVEDGLVVDSDAITGIEKDKALVDVVLTEVKADGDNDAKNLLAAPVVIKLQVYVEFEEITPVHDTSSGEFHENTERERYYAKYTFENGEGADNEVDVRNYVWAKQIKPDGTVYYPTASGDNAIWFPVSDTKYGFRQVEGTHTFYLIKENKGYTFTIGYTDPDVLPGTEAE